jgi:hypothetical protein
MLQPETQERRRKAYCYPRHRGICVRRDDPSNDPRLRGIVAANRKFFGIRSVTSNRDSSLTTQRSIHSAIHPCSDPSMQRSMNVSSPNKNSSGKISGFAAAAASAAFLSA